MFSKCISWLGQFADRIVPKGTLGRHIALLAGSTAMAQGLIVLLSPVLTRLYGPSEFGIFGMFSGAVLVLNTIDSVRYEIAIPLPKEEEKAEQLLLLCCILVFLSSGFLAVIIRFCGATICQRLHIQQLAKYLWLLPASLVGAGLVEAFSYFAVRKQAFGAMARGRLAQSVTQNTVQCILGLIGIGPIALLVGDAFSRLASAIVLFREVRLYQHLMRFQTSDLRHRAVEYSRFPRLNAPATFLNIAALQLPFLALPFFFGMENAGSYFLAYRVLVLPSALIGTATGNVFFSKAAIAQKDGTGLEGTTSRIALGLMAIYLPIYLGLAIAAGPIFGFVFGPKWATAGMYARILTPAAFCAAVSSPLSTLLIVKDRLGLSLALTILDLSGRSLAIAVGSHFHSLSLAVALISTFSTLVPSLATTLFLRWSGVKLSPFLRKGTTIAVANLPLIGGMSVALMLAKPLAITVLLAIMILLSCGLASRFIKDLATAS